MLFCTGFVSNFFSYVWYGIVSQGISFICLMLDHGNMQLFAGRFMLPVIIQLFEKNGIRMALRSLTSSKFMHHILSKCSEEIVFSCFILCLVVLTVGINNYLCASFVFIRHVSFMLIGYFGIKVLVLVFTSFVFPFFSLIVHMISEPPYGFCFSWENNCWEKKVLK